MHTRSVFDGTVIIAEYGTATNQPGVKIILMDLHICRK